MYHMIQLTFNFHIDLKRYHFVIRLLKFEVNYIKINYEGNPKFQERFYLSLEMRTKKIKKKWRVLDYK